jgi:hypothetical protein
MNLKERGITVGDLLIIFLIILTTTILVKTFNKDKKTTLSQCNQEKTLLSNINLNNLSV